MDSNKPAQNIQDSFLNTAPKERASITIYLLSGVKLTGRIRSFDKYSVVLEANGQEQLIFKHAISTVVMGRVAATHVAHVARVTHTVQVVRVVRTPDATGTDMQAMATSQIALAKKQLGPACPIAIAPPDPDELAATLQDWLDEFERVQLMLRLSARLRQKHGD